jgi:hypothetical protein
LCFDQCPRAHDFWRQLCTILCTKTRD